MECIRGGHPELYGILELYRIENDLQYLFDQMQTAHKTAERNAFYFDSLYQYRTQNPGTMVSFSEVFTCRRAVADAGKKPYRICSANRKE